MSGWDRSKLRKGKLFDEFGCKNGNWLFKCLQTLKKKKKKKNWNCLLEDDKTLPSNWN